MATTTPLRALRFNPTSSLRHYTTARTPTARSPGLAPPTRAALTRTALPRLAARRMQSTTAEAAEQSAFKKLWDSPVGPRTVHFWAPVMKWGLVIAGISDLARPAEALSLSQNAALLCTGLIWTRWCFIIKPRNIALAAANFFLFCVGTTQISRIYMYRASQANKSVSEDIKDAVQGGKEKARALAEDPKGVAKDLVGK